MESAAHTSLYTKCHHQIIYDTPWHVSMTYHYENTNHIRKVKCSFNWKIAFSNNDVPEIFQ